MTVYVDPMFATAPTSRWPYKHACHLFSDRSLDELHAFADRLGLRRSWFQKHPRLSHYDLTENKRREAILLGAVSVKGEELKKILLSKAGRLEGI